MPTVVGTVWAGAALLLSAGSGLTAWWLASRPLAQRLAASGAQGMVRVARIGSRLVWIAAIGFAALAVVAMVGSAKVQLIAGVALLALLLVLMTAAVVMIAQATAGRNSAHR